jgi:hypothetical protein
MSRLLMCPLGPELSSDALSNEIFGVRSHTDGTVTVDATGGPYGGPCLSLTAVERRFTLNLPTEISGTIYFGFYIKWSPASVGALQNTLMEFRDGSDVQFSLGFLNSAGVGATRDHFRGLQLRRSNNTVVGSSSYGYPSNRWLHIAGRVDISDTAAFGNVYVNVDGKPAITFTSGTVDTKNTTTTRVGNISICSQTSCTCKFADFIVHNASGSIYNGVPLEEHMGLLNPSGNGNQSDFVGSDADSTDNYLLVGEGGPVLSDYVESATVDATDTYATDNLPASVATLTCLTSLTVTKKTDAGLTEQRHVLRIGGTDYEGAALPIPIEWIGSRTVWELSPATAAAWTTSEVDGLEHGFTIES